MKKKSRSKTLHPYFLSLYPSKFEKAAFVHEDMNLRGKIAGFGHAVDAVVQVHRRGWPRSLLQNAQSHR